MQQALRSNSVCVWCNRCNTSGRHHRPAYIPRGCLHIAGRCASSTTSSRLDSDGVSVDLMVFYVVKPVSDNFVNISPSSGVRRTKIILFVGGRVDFSWQSKGWPSCADHGPRRRPGLQPGNDQLEPAGCVDGRHPAQVYAAERLGRSRVPLRLLPCHTIRHRRRS